MADETHDKQFLVLLEEVLGKPGLLTGAETDPYSVGTRHGQGRALAVARPANTKEVSAVVKLCAAHGVRVVCQGANTGLVGAGVPDSSGRQLVVSLSRLRATCLIDVANRSAVVDAGFLLQELNERLAEHGLWFPIDLGSNPSVGGMVATNTGGTRLIRHGDVRHNLMALEVVVFDPPGEIVRCGSSLRKDNTGIDVKQLFVGTSGAGAIVTQATVEVHQLPKQCATALVVPSSQNAVLQLLSSLESELGDFLSAFEGMSGAVMGAAVAHVPGIRNPFGLDALPEFGVLIELESTISAGATGVDLERCLSKFLEDHFGTLVENAVIGNGKDLWRLRHALSEASSREGRVVAFDISFPRSRIMEFRGVAKELMARDFPELRVLDYGHVADGGLHFSVIWPHSLAAQNQDAVIGELRDAIYRLVQRFGGSFSAEHGVGPLNLPYYLQYTSPAVRRLASGIRRIVDPQHLCGAVDFG